MLPDGSCRADAGWYPLIQGGVCDRGRLCRPQVRCVSDGSAADTCKKRSVGSGWQTGPKDRMAVAWGLPRSVARRNGTASRTM